MIKFICVILKNTVNPFKLINCCTTVTTIIYRKCLQSKNCACTSALHLSLSLPLYSGVTKHLHFKVLFIAACVWCSPGGSCMLWHTWKSEDSFVKLVLASTFMYVPKIKLMRPSSLQGKHFYTLRHLTVSLVLSFMDLPGLDISYKCNLIT